MSRKRRSYEAGHRPKFLVVIDDTPECDRAVYFASRRAARTGAGLVMLRVVETARPQSAMARRRRHHAGGGAGGGRTQVLARFAARANGIAGITPERVIREGENAEEILQLIEEDEDIAVLVLAAGTGKEGPGPLVSSLAQDRPAPSRSRSPSCPATSATRSSTP